MRKTAIRRLDFMVRTMSDERKRAVVGDILTALK